MSTASVSAARAVLIAVVISGSRCCRPDRSAVTVVASARVRVRVSVFVAKDAEVTPPAANDGVDCGGDFGGGGQR